MHCELRQDTVSQRLVASMAKNSQGLQRTGHPSNQVMIYYILFKSEIKYCHLEQDSELDITDSERGLDSVTPI